MNKINDGGPAFPVTAGHEVFAIGVTKREWFAAQALQGLIAKDPFFDSAKENGKAISKDDLEQFRLDMAASSYLYADAMIVESDRGGGA